MSPGGRFCFDGLGRFRHRNKPVNFTRTSLGVEVFWADKPKRHTPYVVQIPKNYEFVVGFAIREFEVILVKRLSCLRTTWVRESVVVNLRNSDVRVFVEKIEATQRVIFERNFLQSSLQESILNMQPNEHRRNREIGGDVLNLKVVTRLEYSALESGV